MSRLDAIRQIIDAFATTEPSPPGTRVTHLGPVRWVHFEKPLGWATDVFRAIEVAPTEVVRIVQSCQPGPHLIRVWTSDPDGIVAPYAHLGYKARSSEALETIMARSLVGFPPGTERYPVQQVQTEEQRRLYNSAIDPDLDPNDPHGPMKVEDVANPILRHYFVEQDGKCVCYAKAILPLPAAVVVEPLWTRPEYRRRGLATAVMNRLHADAAAAGAEQSVLLASPMGVPLYGKLGYQVVAYVQKFVSQEGNPADHPR